MCPKDNANAASLFYSLRLLVLQFKNLKYLSPVVKRGRETSSFLNIFVSLYYGVSAFLWLLLFEEQNSAVRNATGPLQKASCTKIKAVKWDRQMAIGFYLLYPTATDEKKENNAKEKLRRNAESEIISVPQRS